MGEVRTYAKPVLVMRMVAAVLVHVLATQCLDHAHARLGPLTRRHPGPMNDKALPAHLATDIVSCV